MTNTDKLVEEVKRYYSDNFAYISSDQPTLSILTNIAHHFTEWQKEQMLKKATEGEVMLNPYPTICLDDCKDYDFKDGDKVHIIIVKEEK